MMSKASPASCFPATTSDVVLTRQQDKTGAAADVVLQNVRVLAVDQTADERLEKPSIVKAVTLEVEVASAQKLALAATVGTLSLALRKAGEQTPVSTRRITLSDLPKGNSGDDRYSTVSIVRGTQRTEYSVPIEGEKGLASATTR